jgi:hypothetical protein
MGGNTTRGRGGWVVAAVELAAMVGTAVFLLLRRRGASATAALSPPRPTAMSGSAVSAKGDNTPASTRQSPVVRSASRCDIQAGRRRAKARQKAAGTLGLVLAAAVIALWLVMLHDPVALPWVILILVALLSVAIVEVWLSSVTPRVAPRSITGPVRPRQAPRTPTASTMPLKAIEAEPVPPTPSTIARRPVASASVSQVPRAVFDPLSAPAGSYWDRTRRPQAGTDARQTSRAVELRAGTRGW